MRLPWWRPRALTVVVLPEEGGESRSFRLSPRALRWGLFLAVLLSVGGVTLISTWWVLARRAGEATSLRAERDSLRAERDQLLGLADELTRIELQYEHIRSLFGPASPAISSDLWLPPSGLPAGDPRVRETNDNRPTSWPLTEAGFVTQALGEGEAGDHAGLDIAVPSDSYIRAAGAGRVLRVGEDPVYGLFVVLEHGEGYQSVYAHASELLVGRGDMVVKDQVIALTGSTGQSTAPHLHFEILLDGIPVDPLSILDQPS